MYFEVDAGFGGRISSLKLDEEELMFVDRNYGGGYLWGSTFWHSPQGPWGWPPAEELDEDPYSGGIEGKSVILQSDVDPDYDVSFTKAFFASSADTSVTIMYYINNEGNVATDKSPWEVTRVPAEGLSFFPMGEGDVTGGLAQHTEIVNDVTWYQFNDTDDSGNKFFSDGADGWFAHANDNGTIFIKQFADVPFDDKAPDEGEVELWLNGDFAYIELENQGAYANIPAGYLSEYKVKWYVRKLPEDISVEVGNMALVDYANSVIGDPIVANPVRPITPPNDLSITEAADLNVINGILFISDLPSDQYVLNIFDLTGKLIQSTKFNAEDKHNLFLGNTAPGLYIYQLSGSEYRSSGKLVVQ